MSGFFRFLVLALIALGALAPAEARRVGELEKKYQLQVVVAPRFPVPLRSGRLEGQAAPQELLESYQVLLEQEWSRYPVELIAKLGLKRIVLCQGLAYNGQKRTALPDFEHNDLYFDVTRGRHDEAYVRKVIHHELFHLLDWRDDGQLYQDPIWAALNPPAFHYGTGGASLQDDSTVALLTDALPGFLTKYGTSGVEEDKAELFSHALVEPDMVVRRISVDPYLAAKLEQLNTLLNRFSPGFSLPLMGGMREGKER